MRRPALLIVWMLTVLLGQSWAQATTFTVINENASGTGSLRWAVESANTHAGPDLIDFAPSVKVIDPRLSIISDGGLGPLVVTGDLTIQGPGEDKLKIDGLQSWIDPSGKLNTGLPCGQSGTLMLTVSGTVFEVSTPGVNLKVEGMTITHTAGLLAASGNRGGGIIEFSGVHAVDNAPVTSPLLCNGRLIDMGWGGELRITNSKLALNKIAFNVVKDTGLVISRSNTRISGSLFDGNTCYMSRGGEPCNSSRFGLPGTWDLRVFRGDVSTYSGGTADSIDIRDTRFNNLVNRVGFENHDTTGGMAVSITNSAFFERSNIDVAVQDQEVRERLPVYTGVYAMNADLSLTNVSLLLPSYKSLGDGALPPNANFIGSHLNAIGKSTVRVANSVIHTTGSPDLAPGERLAPLVGMTRCGLVTDCQGGVDAFPVPGNAADFPYSYVDDGTLAAIQGGFIGSLIYAGVPPLAGTSIAKNKAANGPARYHELVGCSTAESLPGFEGYCIIPKPPETPFTTNPIFNSGANALAVYPDGTPILKDLDKRDRIIDVTVDMGAAETVVTAKPESYSTPQGVTLQMPASKGVLTNDLNCGTGPLVAQLAGTQGTRAPTPHGNVTLLPDGSLTYTPDPSYVGGDDFSYRIVTQNCPLGAYNVTDHIEVGPVAPPPSQSPGPVISRTVAGDKTIGVYWSAPVGSAGTAISGYKVQIAPDANGPWIDTQDGCAANHVNLSVLPLGCALTGLQNGTSYLVRVAAIYSSGWAIYSAPGLETPNAPTPPGPVPTQTTLMANPDYYAVAPDNVLTAPTERSSGVLANDMNCLSARIDTPPAHGTLTLNPNGGFSYQPDSGFIGTDSFTYVGQNGSVDSNPALVSIRVGQPNGAASTALPPIANPDAWALTQDMPLNIPNSGSLASGVLANDGDPQGYPLTATVKVWPTHGSLTLDPLGGLTYVPDPGFAGRDSFTYSVSNGVMSSEAAVLLVVQAKDTNVAPVSNPDAYATTRDMALNVPWPGVLGNDHDQEGHTLTAFVISQPSHGRVAIGPYGRVNYVPDPGFVGRDSFTYGASDGLVQGSPVAVNIEVNDPANELPPVANADAWSVARNGTLFVREPHGVLANDYDPAGGQLSAWLLSQPQNGLLAAMEGGGFIYTPNAGFSGVDSFTYLVTDGVRSSSPATVTLRVNASNRPPLAKNMRFPLYMNQALDIPPAMGVLSKAVDPDGHLLTAMIKTPPSHGVLVPEPDGAMVYIPAPGFKGVDRFSYSVSDGQLESKPQTVTFRVKKLFRRSIRKPRTALNHYSLPQGSVLDVPANGLLRNDRDPQHDPLWVAIEAGPAHGSLQLGLDGSFRYYPDAGFHGHDRFTYRVFDGIARSRPTRVALRVKANDAQPRARHVRIRKPRRRMLLERAEPGILRFSHDRNGNHLIPSVVDYPQHGLLRMNNNGSFAYYPDAGYKGRDGFNWKVTDGLKESRPASGIFVVR
jgi:hypothetical protein